MIQDAEVVSETALVKTGEQALQMAFTRPPEAVLEEAQKAASALQKVIESKDKKVTFNGETYLEFDDWQTLGRFYGVTAKIVSTEFVSFGEVKGFEARAVAIANDREISGAEAMCLSDERNWGSKPLFQLRSMAQTRACAKVLRNVLAWVVVMAGYRPTPAEEMEVESRASAVKQGTRQQPAKIEAPSPTPEAKTVLDEIKAVLVKNWPSQSADDKARKAESLEHAFETRVWSDVCRLPTDKLTAGLDKLKRIGEQ